MGLSSTQWDAIEPVEKNVFYSRQLWIEPNFRVCFIPGGNQYYLNNVTLRGAARVESYPGTKTS